MSQFTINFQINGKPSTWEELVREATRATKAVNDLSSAFETFNGRKDTRRGVVDDFIRWLAVHQDDGMVEV